MLFNGICSGQSNDSIIYLDEVIISKTKVPKEVLLKNKGTRDERVGFYENQKIVSLITNIPKGKISSITLFFDVKLYKKPKDLELGLLIFEKVDNGFPGKSLTNKEIRFIVKGSKKEKIVLDLTDLEINSQNELFFGFETINLKGGVFIAEMIENKNAVSFSQRKSSVEWFVPVRKVPVELKLNISVVPN